MTKWLYLWILKNYLNVNPTILTHLPRPSNALKEVGHQHRKNHRLLQDDFRLIQPSHVVPLDIRMPLQNVLFQRVYQMVLVSDSIEVFAALFSALQWIAVVRLRLRVVLNRSGILIIRVANIVWRRFLLLLRFVLPRPHPFDGAAFADLGAGHFAAAASFLVTRVVASRAWWLAEVVVDWGQSGLQFGIAASQRWNPPGICGIRCCGRRISGLQGVWAKNGMHFGYVLARSV